MPPPAAGASRGSLACGCILQPLPLSSHGPLLCILSEDTIQPTETPESERVSRSDGVWRRGGWPSSLKLAELYGDPGLGTPCEFSH